MTISYNTDVATASFGTPFRLLSRWKGSVYKLIWKEFLLYSFIFASLSISYRVLMTKPQRETFEEIARYFEKFTDLIPISFVLGFYVSLIVGRWWNQYLTIPWPDRLALALIASLQSTSEKARIMRRTVMRYACLSFTLTMASISPPVFKRFPTLEHVEAAGLFVNREKEIIENIKTPYNKYFVPLIWATGVLTKARKEQFIRDDMALKTILDELSNFRSNCGMLLSYDQMNLPLVYTQVVTISVYTFFFSCLMGRQLIPDAQEGKPIFDPYIPIFTLLQFLFYMGWLKVAEELINPFGEDDDDFDVNGLIDRNLQISYLVVDEMHLDHPELTKDTYWDTVEFDMPYTEASKQFQKGIHIGTAADISETSRKDAEIILPPVCLETINEEGVELIGTENCQNVNENKRNSIEGRKNSTNVKGQDVRSNESTRSSVKIVNSAQLSLIQRIKKQIKIPKLKYRRLVKGLPFISTAPPPQNPPPISPSPQQPPAAVTSSTIIHNPIAASNSRNVKNTVLVGESASSHRIQTETQENFQNRTIINMDTQRNNATSSMPNVQIGIGLDKEENNISEEVKVKSWLNEHTDDTKGDKC